MLLTFAILQIKDRRKDWIQKGEVYHSISFAHSNCSLFCFFSSSWNKYIYVLILYFTCFLSGNLTFCNQHFFYEINILILIFQMGISPYVLLRSCYTVKQVSRYLYHATFCIMILISLHTKSSSMFHAEFVHKLFPPKWKILTMKTLSFLFVFC